jgi:hypothetical protein
VIKGSVLASFTCEEFSTRKLQALSQDDINNRLNTFQQLTHW